MSSAWQPIVGIQAMPSHLRTENDLLQRVVPYELENSSQLTSGCDSSNCAYCQSMVQRRRIRGDSVCWLRRKRSENELANLATNPSPAANADDQRSVPEAPNSTDHRSQQQSDSMWDHALLEPHEAAQILSSDKLLLRFNGSSGKTHTSNAAPSAPLTPLIHCSPWAWNPRFDSRPTPVPSFLTEVALLGAPSTSLHRQSADITCGLEFEEHGWLIATANTAKQVKVYSLAQCLEQQYQLEDSSNITSALRSSNGHHHQQQQQGPASGQPLRVHRLASKLSSLAWNPDQPGVVTLGDYDGCVLQLDLESGHLLAEADEHAGRRVWSVSHSHLRPHFAASGAEDGTAALWAGPGLQQIAARVGTQGNACITSVHLSPFDENHLATACSDATAKVYDIRQLNIPLAVMQGHTCPASYVKFMDRNTLVTAATDATLGVWNFTSIDATSGTGSGGVGGNGSRGRPFDSITTTTTVPMLGRKTRTFTGHTNSKNFVGLSVRSEDRLVACGSENATVFAYCMSWDRPVVAHSLTSADDDGDETSAAFCSAVAWQPATSHGSPPLLAAATSDGAVRVLALSTAEEN